MTRLRLAAAAAFTAIIAALPSAAPAVTFDLSTLNVSGTISRVPVCPCTDPVTGTQIFGNQFNAQSNGWTMGTGATAATLYYMGDGRGNNAGKIYLPSGAPSFPIPPGQSLGSRNSQLTGDFAQADGFPLYFWFGNPGNTTTTPAVGVPVFLDSFYISGGSGNVTVTGYSDLGTTPIPGDSMVITAGALQQVTLDWAGVEQVSLTGGVSYYVNNIEVNDTVAAPAPSIGGPVVLAVWGILYGVKLLGRGKRRRWLGTAIPRAAAI